MILAGAFSWPVLKSQPPPALHFSVSPDGTADFPTIQRAIDHALDTVPQNNRRVVLDIRPGHYRERLKIPQDRPLLRLSGANPATTVITSAMSAAQAGGTFFSSIVEVNGAAFEAENLTFENSFGTGSQAVAVSVHSDRAVFRGCTFLGWQDTLYAASGRQYYKDCRIEGHVDFIFGNAAAVFENCEIFSRGSGYITAHSRTTPDQPTGYVFRRCRLTAPPGLRRAAGTPAPPDSPFPPKDSGSGVFLGRPWRPHARVVYVDCEMGAHIRAEGWDNWRNAANEATAFFAESGSQGPGASAAARVPWARLLSSAELKAFETESFLGGSDGWRPR